MSLLSRVFPPLWGDDRDRLWDLMRAFVPQITLALAPSYAYGVERLPREGGVLVAANHFSGIDHPLIGAFSYIFLKSQLMSITEYWRFVMGVILVLIVVLFPRGLVGVAQTAWARIKRS